MKKRLVTTLSIIFLINIVISGCIDEEEKNNDKIVDTDIEKEAVEIIENLSQNNYQFAYQKFDDTMKSLLNIEDLRIAWEGLISQYGEYKEIITTRKINEENYQIVYVTCDFTTLGYLDVRIVFNVENMIREIENVYKTIQ